MSNRDRVRKIAGGFIVTSIVLWVAGMLGWMVYVAFDEDRLIGIIVVWSIVLILAVIGHMYLAGDND